ncbi:hypothetical protein PQX77_011115 [Marasmius sp. AFHP31]|nr:hypothetical protein PQX77_011115 [Marasmius sp. AFHP31]
MAYTPAMHDLCNSTHICNKRKKLAMPRQPNSPMDSFGLGPGHLFQALKRRLGFQRRLPIAQLPSFQQPPPLVPHTKFAQVATSSTEFISNLEQTVMHTHQAPLERTESEDFFDGPGSITAEEAANIPDELLDASVATDTEPSTSTPRAKRSISLNPKSPKFIRRMASSRATDNTNNTGGNEAGSTETEGSTTPAVPPPVPSMSLMPSLPPWLGSSAGPPPPWLAPTGQCPSIGPPRTFSHSPTPHPTTGPSWFPMPPMQMYNHASNPPPSNPPFPAAANPLTAASTPPSITMASPAVVAPTPATVPPAAVTQTEATKASTEPRPAPVASTTVATTISPETAPEHLRSTNTPTTPSKKAEPTSPTTPRTAGRYSKDETTTMEMGFEEMDKAIGEIAKKLNVAPKTIYARYITRSSHCSRGGNAWNSYQKYLKVTKYMLLEMARLDNDPDLKYDFDTKPTPTADQVSASWQLFKEHHGVQDAEELMAAFEECQEQGTSQTKGARRREFDTLVKNLTTIGRQARNRSHFHVVAFAVGGMVNEDQSLSFVLENDESEGFIEKKLHMTNDRIVGRLRSHIHDQIDEGLRIDEIVTAAESYGLTVTGPQVEKLKTTKGDCRTTLLNRAAECNITFKHNRFPAKNMKQDFMKSGIAIKNWPPTVMIPWEGDVGKKGILALPKDQQALVIDYCLRDDDRKLRFEKVDQKEMMLGNEPILTYAPDQDGEVKRIFEVFKDPETKPTVEKPATRKVGKPKEEPVETTLPTSPSTPTPKRNTRNTRSTTQATTTAPRRNAPKSAKYVEDTESDEEKQEDELTESDDDDALGLLEHDIVNASDYEDKTPTKGGTKRKASTKTKGQKGSEGTAAKKAKSTPAAVPNVQKPAPPARSKSNPTSGDRRVHFSNQEAPLSISAAEFDQGGFTTLFSACPTDQTTSTSTVPKVKAVAPRPTPSSAATPPPNTLTPLAGATNTGAVTTAATVGSAPVSSNAPTTATPPTAAQAFPAPQALQQQPPMPMPPTPQMQQWMLQQQQWMMNHMNQMTPEQQTQQWHYMSQFMPQFMPQMGGGGGIQGGHGNAWGQFPNPNQPQGGAQ